MCQGYAVSIASRMCWAARGPLPGTVGRLTGCSVGCRYGDVESCQHRGPFVAIRALMWVSLVYSTAYVGSSCARVGSWLRVHFTLRRAGYFEPTLASCVDSESVLEASVPS